MIRHWFTRADAPLTSSFVKRFDPKHFTVDFPRGAIASAVLGPTANSLDVHVEFLRKSDLIGLIYASSDEHWHPIERREHRRDYNNCQLRFRWQATGLPGLDEVNGATLTIEGRNSAGHAKTWYVRLWNYATGAPNDALISLDFNQLSGGYDLSSQADPVHPGDIDRMFFSLVPPTYQAEDSSALTDVGVATLRLSEIDCSGFGSVLKTTDAMVPEHQLRICTAYDDLYNLVPERVVETIERLGYRKLLNHYVGMSHHQGLLTDGTIDPARPINSAAATWHSAFLRAARAADLDVIFSLSFEIIASACPALWQQRASDGSPARTGYEPPSALISPANDEAVGYLAETAAEFARLADAAGTCPRIQIGEPWWWVTADHRPCLYDASARTAFGGDPILITDIRGPKTASEIELLDRAGEILAEATETITEAVKAVRADIYSDHPGGGPTGMVPRQSASALGVSGVRCSPARGLRMADRRLAADGAHCHHLHCGSTELSAVAAALSRRFRRGRDGRLGLVEDRRRRARGGRCENG